MPKLPTPETRELFAFVHGLQVAYRFAPLPHHALGLSWTASGYGSRVPTEHMVKYAGRWRRVYCHCHSNCGSLFIGANIRTGLIVELN